ncbi:Ulp1-like peptidase [Cucumis melo var. makuwa]|uniref:Ulp1-like peptidase n=1 Tax=Cucumis melo var. makuwa TaxID=1194695 RepID=A0A5D3DKH6_CUCMM|nr:Ulp1-like peptidase [Cucumis melo var. makuwa]TYK24115.1 Ulp1-like peptidase [Cucumis melo var. makuwa]
MAPLDQAVQILEVPPSISIVNEESQLQTIRKLNGQTQQHLNLWTEEDLEYYFNTTLGDFQDKQGWGDVNYVIGCINIREHWLAIAADIRKCKIYVFDSMPNYVRKKLVDKDLEMSARCIPSLAIEIGMNLHSKHFEYSPWSVVRSNTTFSVHWIV